MGKFMRILVMFDLPVKTKLQRKAAAGFRKFLINDGYYMVQYSIYARVCNGNDAAEKHTKRIKRNLPDNGAIRLLTITEKQYQNVEILLGNYVEEDNPFECEQLTIF